MSPNARRGFTLIELLVVISIIALLMSLLLPALRAARDAGQGAKCLANIRSFGLGLHNYFSDSNNVIPPWEVGDFNPEKGRIPVILVGGGYLPGETTADKNSIRDRARIFQCPTDTAINAGSTTINAEQKNNSYHGNNHVFPSRYSGAGWHLDTQAPYKLHLFPRPSNKLALTEKRADQVTHQAVGITIPNGPGNDQQKQGMSQKLIDQTVARHSGGANVNSAGPKGSASVLFLDGHGAILARSVLILPAMKWVNNPGDPNPDPTRMWGIRRYD